ncbi:hypothetical protein JK386_16925 [Nocardioides sp. zg-536]|uniref:PQ-loop repeat-containing protein n=1 Tax=Nocardioides faecalis TaxID=2803858 RepID=A0A938Y9C9_9ACTN|nr:hypothetical protein [Nocardioides faecalis]MBM9461587.1 hypothetical protein [Nocardioides faecalis]QVI57780.1 hypothetical protein KG111_11980 [Nocardioides faecalis]
MMEVVGYVGTAGAATMWLPQAYRALRHRHDAETLSALSRASYTIAVLFNVLLVCYGWLEHARPVVLAGFVNLLCATVILATITGSARRHRADQPADERADQRAGRRAGPR